MELGGFGGVAVEDVLSKFSRDISRTVVYSWAAARLQRNGDATVGTDAREISGEVEINKFNV